MKITRDVIIDLLPLYLSGEASADTRALVVEYVSSDPELAARIHAQDADLVLAPATLPPELELKALTRTRAMLAWSRWLFALAIAFSVMASSLDISFKDGHVDTVQPLLSNYPVPFVASLALAIGCWIAYFLLRRRLRM